MARPARQLAGFTAAVLSLALLAAPAASASTPFLDIHSAGPLSDIYIGNDLSCQVRSGGFSSTEFFPNAPGPGDCGTFLDLTGDNVSGGLWGPDFANHAGGTHTSFPQTETPFTSSPGNQSLTGSGTAPSPYRLTTTVTLSAPTGNTPVVLELTEIDSYVVGADTYRTDVTITNTGTVPDDNGGWLYHAGDCQLRGSDTGLGAFETNAAACTPNQLGSPPSALEEFAPITSGDSWEQTTSPTIWSDLNDNALADSCLDCRGSPVNNADGIAYSFAGISPGQSQGPFSFETEIVDTVPAGGLSLTGSAGTGFTGTVATITDPNTSATASAYSATIDWGDGTTSPGTISGGSGSFTVTGTHPYGATGTYPVAVTITAVGTNQGSSTVADTATITAPPSPVVTGTPSVAVTSAGFTGSVNPDGLLTTAQFQYALDPKYTGGGPLVYTEATPAQTVGSDFTSHTVSAAVSGLVPNALYHVRLVASNNAGTSFGPDLTFTTQKGPNPSSPTVGNTFNIAPVSGVVLIKVNGQLVPLTELRQIPKNTLIDALHGTLQLTTALGGSGPARDAAAKGKKPKKPKTQTGQFGGGVFKISQAKNGADKGLVTLSLVDGAVTGDPSYGTCSAHKAAEATIASSRTLQLLHASAHGKFSTRGRYSAATVRGTKWTVADRCDGTLTHDITDSVAVTDFVHHRTIVLHAGQSYLAKAPKHK
ncbi:MAG: hypothetical protein JO027_16040 [Solirubrobacterales bacterium]|nr:hypothetical protein [Solirubrobacterales bacterium]